MQRCVKQQESSGKHSLLHNITIATPCTASWDLMEGDERKRFCGDCKLNVYNISEMTESDAEKLIVESEGRLCLRLYRRSDGTVLTKDCPVGLRAKIKSYSLKTCAAIAAVVSATAAYIMAKDAISAENYKRVVQERYEQNYCKLKGPPPVGIVGAMYSPPPPPKNDGFEMGKLRAPATRTPAKHQSKHGQRGISQ